TKVFHSVEGDPADHGLSRERILRQIDGSLLRLGVDHVAMYLIHEPDPETPLDETLGALEEVVRAGKARAIGASNVDVAWLEQARGRVQWVQNSYSLLDRESEAVLRFCAERGLGFTPFSPLAGGWLSGKYRRGEAPAPGSRMATRPEPYLHLDEESVYRGLDGLAAAASQRGVDMPTLALAWVLADPRITAVVLGPRRPEHLEPGRAALDLELTPDERDQLASLFP
ncbi:MAG: aldo/keto reductase, partial [Gaiellaceae bacterium]